MPVPTPFPNGELAPNPNPAWIRPWMMMMVVVTTTNTCDVCLTFIIFYILVLLFHCDTAVPYCVQCVSLSCLLSCCFAMNEDC